MFLLTLQLKQTERRRLAVVLFGAACASACLGIAQITGGPQSPLRPYDVTNPGMAVGFFANGNHQATLLLCALAFVGYLMARSAGKRTSANGKAALAAASMIGLFLVIGVAVVGSIAGYGLLIPVAVGALLIYRKASAGKVGWLWGGATGVVGVAALAAMLVGPVALQDLASDAGASPISRRAIAATTVQAAAAHFPVGTGLGTFADVYRGFQDPFRPITAWVNHAHNDYLEVVLETGLVGILLILAFFIWFGRQAWRAWNNDREGGNLARAATVALGAVMIHSLVDYPLRTSAIAVVFAMACAMLLPPRGRGRTTTRSGDDGPQLRHLEAN